MSNLARYAVAVVVHDGSEGQDHVLVQTLSRRAPRGVQSRYEMDEALAQAGYAVAAHPGRAPRSEWPLLALVYRSPNPEGVGRCASTLYRVRCKKI